MNKLDKDYCNLLQDILENGTKKQTRNGETLSVFGRQIRHKMSEGFPLLTTKKMYWKGIVTEILWFLRGDTNIKFLVDNDCHIWNGDCYANYLKKWKSKNENIGGDYIDQKLEDERPLPKDMFIHLIKTDDEFAKKWGELGPIYGKQWRNWKTYKHKMNFEPYLPVNKDGKVECYVEYTDQIQNLINELKTNPDSRRLLVTAWQPSELESMTLPPCHYGFQVYTRELSVVERIEWYNERNAYKVHPDFYETTHEKIDSTLKSPRRAISLMWNQRSVDTFLGLPFNIASYGLLLEIIAKTVNMVPEELIGNLGDVHLYSNHIEQAREQIGIKLTVDERMDWWFKNRKPNRDVCDDVDTYSSYAKDGYFDSVGVPKTTREPYPLPILNINTEWWPTESGECGVGPLDAVAVFNSFKDDNFCKCFLEEDVQLEKYQSHPAIKASLSN